MIADACWHEFTGGVPWHRMAVLFRTNAQSSLFETALDPARRAVPRRRRAAVRGPSRGARCCSTSSARPNASAPGALVRRSPRRPRRRRRHRRRRDADADRTRYRRLPRTGTRPPAAGTTTTSCGRTATRCSRSAATTSQQRSRRAASVAGFVSWLDFATRGESGDERGVDLVTFHRAKGLEWQVVFVTGLERGLVPDLVGGHARRPAPRSDACCTSRSAAPKTGCTARGRASAPRTAAASTRQPSPWLATLEQAIDRVPVAPVDRKARVGDALATLEHAATPVPTSHARRLSR